MTDPLPKPDDAKLGPKHNDLRTVGNFLIWLGVVSLLAAMLFPCWQFVGRPGNGSTYFTDPGGVAGLFTPPSSFVPGMHPEIDFVRTGMAVGAAVIVLLVGLVVHRRAEH